ncbi:MAG TPA: hypothetical protein ENK72_02170, partial [Epsilonproteobacteria bacterium]|nr:hypothetical protein [Campylobacterota bacterium]
MRRLFWFLLLLFIPCQVVDACAVCKLQTPAVHVTVSQQHSDHEMQLRINWVFSEYFSAETKLTYDENKNNQLEQSEIDAIHQSFIEYRAGEHDVTYLQYLDQEGDYETEPHLALEVR